MDITVLQKTQVMRQGQITVVYASITVIPMKRMTIINDNELTHYLGVILITLIKMSIFYTLTN